MKSLFRFYTMTKELDAQSPYQDIDSVGKEILFMVGNARLHNQLIGVSDILRQQELASPATLHARLKQLRDKGFIEILPGEDNRFKYLKPSALALDYFHQLSKFLKKSAQLS
ncbi:MAG: winged helix-turn-helix domain-containing protein [Betaproteobacteria bacterium]|nr:winged helix-turn-helix domain-containing protein [Betaproteobacteria bacterium]MDE2422914.1 winged helix-turn-helix domain-containing protein [Betaproteobacteria bacterium]